MCSPSLLPGQQFRPCHRCRQWKPKAEFLVTWTSTIQATGETFDRTRYRDVCPACLKTFGDPGDMREAHYSPLEVTKRELATLSGVEPKHWLNSRHALARWHYVRTCERANVQLPIAGPWSKAEAALDVFNFLVAQMLRDEAERAA